MKKLSDILPSSIDSSKQVRKAEVNDISGVISVLEQNLIANKATQKPEILEQTGFLINSFSFDDAKSAIEDKDNFIFLVSTNNNEIIGYTIACDVKKLNPVFQEDLSSVSAEIKNIISSEKKLYLRHIAKKVGESGIGKGLLQQLVDHSIHAGYRYIICVIAE